MKFYSPKYKVNPETLRLEPAVLSGRKRIMVGITAGLLVIIAAVSMRIFYDYNAKTPRLVYYEKINAQLRQDYRKLGKELKKDESFLYSLQRKDDRLYRSIFGMEPLPASIREAGTGGSVKNSSIQSISDPELVVNVFNELDKILTKAKIQSSSFEDLEEAALENQLLLARKPLIQPISPANRYWLTSTFGFRTDPFTKKRKSHHGIDLAGPIGLEIHATGDGVVTLSEYNRYGYGKEVMIDHDFGYTSRYAHLHDIFVKNGEEVKRGQVIGTLGNTGRSTGPHLHYEVRHYSKAINPVYCYFEELSPKEYELISKRAEVE